MARVLLKLPKLAVSMQEGRIVEWHVEDGDIVTAGQKLYDVEGDKTTFEVESPADGTVKRLFAKGETVSVGVAVVELQNR
jgi:pyruvate/2-oxoglutarate dehydrogenase complex dihydrolipoamide acyltransferase (E2) component